MEKDLGTGGREGPPEVAALRLRAEWKEGAGVWREEGRMLQAEVGLSSISPSDERTGELGADLGGPPWP